MRVSIRELAGAILPRGAEPRVLALLRAYLDESFGRAGRMLIAGFIGTDAEWDAVGEKWAAALQLRDAPYFHGSELKAQKGAFERWERWRCDALSSALAEIIADSGLGEISVSFRGDWSNVLRQAPKLEGRFPNAYAVCFEHAVSKMQRAAARWYEGDFVACVFDEKDDHQQRGRRLAEMRHAAGEWANVNSVTYANDKTTVQLQCADMLAHELLQCTGKSQGFTETLPLLSRLHPSKNPRRYSLGSQTEETLLRAYRRDPELKDIFDPPEPMTQPPSPDEHDALVAKYTHLDR